MKIIPFLGAFLIGFWGNPIAQVFVSDIFTETIIMGPDNITFNHYELANHYVMEIEKLIPELVEIERENNELISNLKSKENLKWKEQNELRKAIVENERIEEEMIGLEEILSSWKNLQKQNELIPLILNWEIQNNCYIASTNKGVFEFSELNFKIIELDHSDFTRNTEFVPVEIEYGGKEWVKKKADRNCQSADPNDCLVWCLVERKTSYIFIDAMGYEHKESMCPTNFELTKDGKSCIREISEVDLIPISRRIEARLYNSNELIEVFTWRQTECK